MTEEVRIRDANLPSERQELAHFFDALQHFERAFEPDRRIDDRVGEEYFDALMVYAQAGNDYAIPVAPPWTVWFSHAVYGDDVRPIACHKNKDPDALTSHPFFQTKVVVPGDILGRYRDLNTGPMFGYIRLHHDGRVSFSSRHGDYGIGSSGKGSSRRRSS